MWFYAFLLRNVFSKPLSLTLGTQGIHALKLHSEAYIEPSRISMQNIDGTFLAYFFKKVPLQILDWAVNISLSLIST